MEKFEIILFFSFLVVISKNTIYQLFLWQLKEYRWDRFWIHLNIRQGRKLLFGKKEVFKWLLLFFTPFFFLFSFSNLIFLLVFILFSFEAGSYIKQLLTHGWKLPDFTFKTVLVMALVFLLCLGTIFAPGFLPIKLLIFDRLLLLVVTILVVLTNIPAKIYQQFIIQKAKQKIKNHSDLLVIGITGSYGKSSTKEFLAQILASKFKVLKTPANFNTAIGIAKTILKDLKKEHQIFVCEMGAYKKGEIKSLCDIVKPKIGLITGLNEQHQALFGSLENTISAKFELIEALPKTGLAIFNGYNKYCLEMSKKAKKMGRGVKVAKKEKNNLKINFAGEYFLENIHMAKAVAEELGIESKEITQLVKKIKPPAQTMQIFKKNGLILIDSTYNSNPQGVLAGLEHLKTYSGKKIFVFQPIIELGKASAELHQKIGKKAGEICDLVILTNKNFYKDFLKGTKEKVTLKKDLPKIKKGAILFEGKEARSYLDQLTISN